MSIAVNRYGTKQPTVCAVCRRHAVWLGYAPRQNAQLIWLCDDNKCHAGAKKVYVMPNSTLDAYEIGAALEAAADAGGYLEEIGKTDLTLLNDAEWREFLRRMFTGFEQVLRRKILGDEAPF